MLIDLLLFVQRAPQGAPQTSASTVMQAVLLGLAITFIFSVFAAGFTAKKTNNIHNPTYGKAFIATVLKNLMGLAGFFVFGLFLQAQPIVAFGIAFSVIPIAIYKVVFSCMWREAALIWLVALVVEAGVFYGLTLVGVLALRPA